LSIKRYQLDIKPRRVIVFVGPSGCGKSTLLRMISGLEEISAGNVRDWWRSRETGQTPPALAWYRPWCFQAMLCIRTWQSVRQYGVLSLRELAKGEKTAEYDQQVRKARWTMLQLTPVPRPFAKSAFGGQRSVCDCVRLFAGPKKVFLFDEPFCPNLDAALRVANAYGNCQTLKTAGLTRTMMVCKPTDQVEVHDLGGSYVLLSGGNNWQGVRLSNFYWHPAMCLLLSLLARLRWT